jgi:hypothetical protein
MWTLVSQMRNRRSINHPLVQVLRQVLKRREFRRSSKFDILCWIGNFFPKILVCCTKKHLAALLCMCDKRHFDKGHFDKASKFGHGSLVARQFDWLKRHFDNGRRGSAKKGTFGQMASSKSSLQQRKQIAHQGTGLQYFSLSVQFLIYNCKLSILLKNLDLFGIPGKLNARNCYVHSLYVRT